MRMQTSRPKDLRQCFRRRRDLDSGGTGTPLYTPGGERGVFGISVGVSLVAVGRNRRPGSGMTSVEERIEAN